MSWKRLRALVGWGLLERLHEVNTAILAPGEELKENRFTTIEQRHVKEQEIGRHCYEAEEDLSPLELNTLKRVLGINDTRWQACKAKFIDGSSPGGLV
jgi:hypothetical protein